MQSNQSTWRYFTRQRLRHYIWSDQFVPKLSLRIAVYQQIWKIQCKNQTCNENLKIIELLRAISVMEWMMLSRKRSRSIVFKDFLTIEFWDKKLT